MSNITVACKLPNGLILKVGNTAVTLNGANSSRIVGGYGLTTVDKDFYEAWAEKFASFQPLQNDLIFVQDTANKAEAQAKEQSDVRSGLEPLNPDTPVPGVKPAAEAD
jgi:hypothetical protein